MNAQLLLRGVATLALTATFGVAGSVAVDAGGTPPQYPLLAPMKALCNTGVERRVAVLSADGTFVETSVAATAADQSTLERQISADEHGITTLNEKIQHDTTTTQAYDDCALIVTDYLVYVMEDPKIQEVLAADGVTKVNSTLVTVLPELQALINVSQVASSLKATAQADLTDASAKVGASRTSITGVTSSVIDLVPAGWPGDATTLTRAWQRISAAGTDLAAARADVNSILGLLGQ
ncbi:MAG TPA: hypothetical protein VI434_12045 [Candidatus Dormibacteraeota bacterium]